eukprot:NODE_589_length_5652_cov_0.848730.p2 type:complete len:359 gc:universal NODE_589_length_5652_cov_0.848730:2641-1565(-)
MVEIFKSGNTSEAGRYRPINLISIAFKTYQKLLYYNHYRFLLFPSVRQHGFTQQRSCSTQIKSVLEKMKEFKQETGEVHAIALDLSSAFDMMRHCDIYTHLSSVLVDHDLNLLKTIICGQRFNLPRDLNRTSIAFERGTPQGGTLSPMLFAFVLDKIMTLFPNTENYSFFFYADDCIIVAKSNAILKNITDNISTALSIHGFRINPHKYQYITSNQFIASITLRSGCVIGKQHNMKYLGVLLSADGIDFINDVAAKLQKAELAIKTIAWTKKYLCFKSAFKLFYNSVLIPIYTYSIENYSMEGIEKLEDHRVKMIKLIHKNKYRYHQYINNYMDMYHVYQSKLFAFNRNVCDSYGFCG